MRAALLPAVVGAPRQVQSQLVEASRLIVDADFPSKWPDLLSILAEGLNAGDGRPDVVAGCLAVARTVCRKYEFRGGDEQRAELDTAWSALGPRLEALLRRLLHMWAENPASCTEEAGLALKLCLKCLWSALYSGVPTPLMANNGVGLLGWLELVADALGRSVPTVGVPEDDEDRARWPWYKIKKWSWHIAGRLVIRLGDETSLQRPEDLEASRLFRGRVIGPLTGVALRMAGELASGSWQSPRAQHGLLSFLGDALAIKESYAVLEPHLEQLSLSVAFPLLCFNDSDAQLWEEDPVEWVRKGYDTMADVMSPRNAAAGFIVELADQRPKKGLPPLMAHISGILGEHTAAAASGASVPVELARRMDGALLAVGVLAETLSGKKRYRSSVEPMLLTHVLPAFTSPHGFIRAKVCWAAAMFADHKFAAGRGRGPSFGALVTAVVGRLEDPEMPVRVDACVALGPLVESIANPNDLEPALPLLLRCVFSLLGEIESEDLVSVLETVVERMGDAIAPYAIDLVGQLTAALGRALGGAAAGRAAAEIASGAQPSDEAARAAAAAGLASPEADESGALAAYNILRALCTVVDAVSDLPQLFPSLESLLLPILVPLLQGLHGEDFVEETLELLSYLTYYRRGGCV